MAKKPVITFDMDDVLCDVTRPFVLWHNEKYGTSIAFEDIVADNLHELLGLTKHQEFDRWDEFFNLPEYMEIEPDPETVMVLERLHENFKIIIVTARNPKFQHAVRPWLSKFLNGLWDDVQFITQSNGTKRSKGEVCKELKSVLHVDDEPSHYSSCHKNGIKFIFFTTPWNMTDTNCDGRIDSFSQIYKYLPL